VSPLWYSMGMTNKMHRRWTTVLSNSADDDRAGRDMVGWVGVSDAPVDDFQRGTVHGRKVDADQHCTTDCPGNHG
jgi:hypothetical protein